MAHLSESSHYHIGFALSGGLIKGFAHLGAIQALMEHDIRPHILSGVSAGALAGVFVADGYEPYRMVDFFKGMEFHNLTDMVIPKKGFFDIRRGEIQGTGMSNSDD